MPVAEVRLARAAGGAVAAEAAQIAATFAWVAIYSYLIAPGLPVAAYEAYAQRAGPWVSVIAGVPIFYAASRWIARSVPSSYALFVVFLLTDLALVALVPAPDGPVPYLMFALSYVTKLVACHLGGSHATRRMATVSP